MGSDAIYYEYKKHENIRFDPDPPYKIPIEALMADQPLSSSEDGKSSTRRSRSSRRPASLDSSKGMSSAQCVPSSSSTMATSSFRSRVASKMLRMPKSWELIPPSESWMCD
ncbi:hypothetical protein PIB30_039619 [Stylosanthes scabra]|uniref:Uncharacterized protein n=1 Tax=Stylosanthes scabra TaxID=79078 RepID=A0ABU6QEW1_9FABA|nr:hypothetical protein [Stylosanthes scabra]